MSFKRGYTSGQSLVDEEDNDNEQVRDLPMIDLHKIDKSPNRTELTITGKLRNRFSAMDVIEEARASRNGKNPLEAKMPSENLQKNSQNLATSPFKSQLT